jgi:hypothetical protein
MSFENCTPSLTCKYTDKKTHGGNHAPSVADWFKDNDDTLSRQGKSKKSPNGHGICKGTASAWVIAFLSGEIEASDPKLYEAYYTNFLRYQATMIKDSGKHIDTHLEVLERIGLKTTLRPLKAFSAATFTVRDGHMHARWATYASVWHHDIAFGGSHGSSGPFYIVEPNTGLLGYSGSELFIKDLNAYISERRTKKGLPETTEAAYWVYI